MTKLENVQMEKVPATALELIRFMIRPYKKRSILFFSLSFIGTLMWCASPVVVADIISKLGVNRTVGSDVWFLVGLYVLLRIGDEVFWRMAEAVMRSYKPQMIERVRAALFSSVLKKPYSYSVNASSGRIGHWINRTTSTLNEFVDTSIWNVWGRVIGLTISAVFLFLVHWSLGLLFTVWLVALFAYTTHRGKEFGRLIALQSDEESLASGLVVDSLSNHLSVRVFNAQSRERQLLRDQQEKIIHRWRSSWWQNLITNIAKGNSAALASAVALVLAVLLYSNGTIALGGVVLFLAYFGDASSSLWQLAWSLDTYYRNFGTMQNALDGLAGENDRSGAIVAAADMPKQVTLQLQDVSFAYQDNKNETVLKDINLTIPSGKKLGIVGHSGAGKSTLVSLLLRFYDPTSGRILVNDIDVLEKRPILHSNC